MTYSAAQTQRGKDLRVCVRLYQMFVDKEPELVGEAGTLEYAIELAITVSNILRTGNPNG